MKKYTADYDKALIFNKVHHELNQVHKIHVYSTLAKLVVKEEKPDPNTLASAQGSPLHTHVIIASDDLGSKVITHNNYTRVRRKPGDEATNTPHLNSTNT